MTSNDDSRMSARNAFTPRDAIVFLASDQGRMITGQTLPVDGDFWRTERDIGRAARRTPQYFVYPPSMTNCSPVV